MDEAADIAIIGAGAAGLMASIWAGRAALAAGTKKRIILLDGAKSLGAKILVAGGGRCNVTHDVVDERGFAGSSPHAIRRVLRRFDVPRTIVFFRELGVELKREETGKLFPTTDRARTVLDALLSAARAAGVEVRHPWRVVALEKVSDTFFVRGPSGATIRAGSLCLATGGKSLPKTGSDGGGYDLARGLGHSITPRVFPALVPLTLPAEHFICDLSGLSAMVTLAICSGSGRRMASFTDSLLCAHFGVSGPVALDISRYFTDARVSDPGAVLSVSWLPGESMEAVDAALVAAAKSGPARWLRERGLPARLAEAICSAAGVDPALAIGRLTRAQRRALARAIAAMPLPITGDRGYAHAEVTAGGVPLGELRVETMESRLCPRLFIIGEVCDVDGRIGGYNFQWAWASGHVAGLAAAAGAPRPGDVL